MAAHDYAFFTVWRVHAPREEVAAILAQALEFPRWWPDVYLAITAADSGSFLVHSRGWLPYTLRWWFAETERRLPETLALKAWGDLEGTGRWEFIQEGEDCLARFEWRVRAEKPLLRWLSPVLKPVFAANHRWAMARGQESLERELVRRRLPVG